jgi:hypothetical protein
LDSVAVSLASTTQVTTETLTATASVVTVTLAGTTADDLVVTASLVSGPAFIAPILSTKESTTADISGSGTSSVTVSPLTSPSISQATGKFNLYLNAPSTAGTYVVRLTPTGGTFAVATNVTIVVSEKVIQAPSATNSKLYLAVDLNTAVNDPGAFIQGATNARYSGLFEGYAGGLNPVNLVDTKTVAVTPVGQLIGTGAWVLKGADTTVNAKRTPVTITVTGPAFISMQTDPTSPYSAKATSITEVKNVTVGNDPFAPGSQDGSFWIYSTGVGGKVTVTATMDGVTLGTRTFSSVGTPIALNFGTPSKTVVGVGETMSVTVTGADSLGTSTGAASVWASSSDATIAEVNSTQASTVVVTGKKSGTATITVRNAATAADATMTKTVAIKVGAVTAKTVTFSFDNMTPQPGEKVTMTVEAIDASGNAVGDGPRDLFSSTGVTTGLSVQGATWLPASATVNLVGGKATYSFYAPTGTGSLVVTATEGAATDSTTKGTISGTIAVNNVALDAATDAANEALDAAIAATDAALAAAEAADAATSAAQEASDAVAALSESVTKLITDLQAQIKSLAAVVAKIAKKVKA